MDKQDFEKFLNEQTKPILAQAPIDWNKQRDEFIKFLSELFTSIEGSLSEYTEAGKISISKELISINEEYIGNYEANRLNINFGQHRISLTPIGTNLIGAKGRVDMKGPKGTAKIILVSDTMRSISDNISVTISIGDEKPVEPIQTKIDEIQWVWRFIDGNKRTYIPVNEKTIMSAIMELTNG